MEDKGSGTDESPQLYNNSSIKAVIKAGFKKEGMLRESLRSSKNKRIDEIIFGMLKKEFLKKYEN